jgi:hypothetical protein
VWIGAGTGRVRRFGSVMTCWPSYNSIALPLSLGARRVDKKKGRIALGSTHLGRDNLASSGRER